MLKRTYQRCAQHPGAGVVAAGVVIGLWVLALSYNLAFHAPSLSSPLTYLLVLVQAHLFTGLFITAHDAMHGVAAPGNARLNRFLGRLALSLYLFNSYDRLLPKHIAHHRHAGTQRDPDFHRGNGHFFAWFFCFMKEHASWRQILMVAVAFNVAQLFLPQDNLALFWVVAPVLSLIQLFFFGTYRPHRGEHDNPHRARSQRKNHVSALLSCYFFGYHYEHHDSPRTAWWRLWELKECGPAQAGRLSRSAGAASTDHGGPEWAIDGARASDLEDHGGPKTASPSPC